VKLAKNPEFHKQWKHIEVWYYFVPECYQDGHKGVGHMYGVKQLADLLMKLLDQVWFETKHNDVCLRLLMGMQLSTKFVKCLGGSVKYINTVWWTRLFVTAAIVLVSMS